MAPIPNGMNWVEHYRVYLGKAEKKRAELDRVLSEKEAQLDRLRKESARIEKDLRAAIRRLVMSDQEKRSSANRIRGGR